MFWQREDLELSQQELTWHAGKEERESDTRRKLVALPHFFPPLLAV